MTKLFATIKKIKQIIEKIGESGGTAYLVGGSVRDFVLGREVKDFDIEVHGLALDALENILKQFGPVSLVGKKFGVLKLHYVKGDDEKLDVDWSLPRRDSSGRKPTVEIDPSLTIEEACRRRDVTMNAMALRLNDFDGKNIEIIDPYGGQKAIQDGVLRVVDEKLFVEDPLRFYRVMQFIARFEMEPDETLSKICKEMDLREVEQGGELARERIYEEIKKLLLKSKRPSLGFRWVQSIGRLKELFPELGALDGIAQRADYHPEVDAFEHTMQALDAAAAFLPEFEADDAEKFMLMLGVLCHDLGKATTTDSEGRSKGHDTVGVGISKRFLKRFTWNSHLIRAVGKLVRYHRMPFELPEQGSSSRAYKRLAIKLAPEVTALDLAFVARADIRGRNSAGHEPLVKGFNGEDKLLEEFLAKIASAKVEKGPEKPVLQGRDLLDMIEPGPEMGKILREAYRIQIDEGVTDKKELIKRVLK